MFGKRIALLAGAAALSVAAIIAPARAGDSDTHLLTVQLPDGTLAQIRYAGDVAPQLVLAPEPALALSSLDRMMAAMDRQLAELMRMTLPDPEQTMQATMVGMPAGNDVCTRSVTITAAGDGTQPRVVSQTSGDCGAATPTAPKQLEVRAPEAAPRLRTVAWQG